MWTRIPTFRESEFPLRDSNISGRSNIADHGAGFCGNGRLTAGQHVRIGMPRDWLETVVKRRMPKEAGSLPVETRDWNGRFEHGSQFNLSLQVGEPHNESLDVNDALRRFKQVEQDPSRPEHQPCHAFATSSEERYALEEVPRVPGRSDCQ